MVLRLKFPIAPEAGPVSRRLKSALLGISGGKMYAGKKIRVIFHERIPETVPIANLLSRQELPVNIPTLFKDQDPRRISVDSVLLLLYLRLNRRQGYGRTDGRIQIGGRGAAGVGYTRLSESCIRIGRNTHIYFRYYRTVLTYR